MGYSTDFKGAFILDKQLSLDDYRYLKKLGEDYEVDNLPDCPGGYCQWVPTEDGHGIEWNGGEKFRCYDEWLQWIIDQILIPKGYVLTGSVKYQGEEASDSGTLEVSQGMVIKKDYDPKTASIKELVSKALGDDDDRAPYYIGEIAAKLGIVPF